MSAPARRRRRKGGLVALAAVLCLALGAALAGPSVWSWATESWQRANAACAIRVDGEEVPLTRAQAQAATTAVARNAQASNVQERLDQAIAQDPALADLESAPEVLDTLASATDSRLTCDVDQPNVSEQSPAASGLTPRAEQVRQGLQQVFGEQQLGGFAPGGVSSGHGAESTHYDGRAIDIFFTPIDDEATRRQGWQVAHWLVAHAEDLDVQYVIWDDRWWGGPNAHRGWRDYDAPQPANATLRHLDHVHVDVWRGSS